VLVLLLAWAKLGQRTAGTLIARQSGATAKTTQS
jgi:hypothetical protein